MLIIKVIKKVILSLLRFIYKYIRYHITTAIFFTKKITLNTNRGLFCFLFNLNALIRKKNIKFYYDVRNKIYFAKSDKYKKYFYDKYGDDSFFDVPCKLYFWNKNRIGYLSLIYNHTIHITNPEI